MSNVRSSQSTVSNAEVWYYAAPLATVVMWSGNAIVTKMASGVISPSSIAFYRWALALLVLAPFVGPAAWRKRAIARQAWYKILITGILGMVIFQCLAYVAAETTTAINIGIIQALMPLFSTLLASVLASEQLTAPRMLGALISISGLVYLTSRGNPLDLLSGGLHSGDALMLVAVFANALYGVLLRRWSIALTIWEQMFWQVVSAVIVLFPIWIIGERSPITLISLPLVLYAAIAASLIAPACWMYGINRLGAARTALTVNLLPVITAALAWFLIDEKIRYYHYIGGGVALLGVIVGLREWKVGRPRMDEPQSAVWPSEEI